MNNFYIEVKKFSNRSTATDGVNQFIQQCNDAGVEILDMDTHFSSYETGEDAEDNYVFIFKLRKGE